MKLYLLMDDNPERGYFSAWTEKPDVRVKPSAREIRVVNNFPEDVWRLASSGGLPVDDDDTNDETWIEWWTKAKLVWRRDG